MILAIAHSNTQQLLAHLQPNCLKIQEAGSVRRWVADVNDLELVCLPKYEDQKDLFGNVSGIIRCTNFINALPAIGKHISGDFSTGRHLKFEVNGAGINLDLFCPQPHDYYRILAIRTGSRDYSHRILATAWLKKGWCGTPDGLRLIEQSERKISGGKTTWSCNHPNPTLPPAWQSEEEFFNWLGIPFLNPKIRI
jgi:DNA polymerase/3'-5' exonuclease PolX